MTASTVKGIDLSVYQGAIFADAWAQMKADGQAVAVVGSWHGTRPNTFAWWNLIRARKAGLKTATYIAINGSRGGWAHVNGGRGACFEQWQHLNFVAIDVEIRGVTEGILDDALTRVVALGGRPCIYTGRWFWNWWALSLGHLPGLGRPGGVSRYASYPLWTALYDGRPTLDVPLYGGWERAVGHQYAGTTAAYGTQVDLNVFDARWITEPDMVPAESHPVPPKEEGMPSKEYQELKGLVDHLAREVRGYHGTLTAHIEGHPKPAPAPAPKPGPRYYTVVSGDTATGIAAQHGLFWDQFKGLNSGGPPSGNWNLIYPGEKYRVA